ncbi:hypothetical protein KBI23_04620 [bacterium]|nr:hypothetical protein [bacterium]MBP9807389.1 hypothetical protein [bacterium]
MGKKKPLLAMISILLGLLIVEPIIYTPADARALSESDRKLELQFAGQQVLVTVAGRLNISQSDLQAYVTSAALAVGKIYGHIPAKRTVIRVEAVDGDSVGFATSTYDDDNDCGLIEIAIGRNTSRETLDQSWTLTHEMLHLGFPIVEHSKRWLAEGIATYEEPIGRLRMGMISADDLWGDLMRYGPTGLPQPGDRGLNYSRTFERIYWGGAIYCLLADIEIRQKTGNRYGLEHALRGIASGGGTARSDWSASQALAAGDQALNLDVLRSLYKKMAFDAYPVDLARLWQQLGIKRTSNGIVFDNSAPLAKIRQAIERGSQ